MQFADDNCRCPICKCWGSRLGSKLWSIIELRKFLKILNSIQSEVQRPGLGSHIGLSTHKFCLFLLYSCCAVTIDSLLRDFIRDIYPTLARCIVGFALPDYHHRTVWLVIEKWVLHDAASTVGDAHPHTDPKEQGSQHHQQNGHASQTESTSGTSGQEAKKDEEPSLASLE